MSHRLTRRTWAALGILLVAIPALMAVFVCVWDERKYYLTSLLLVGLMFVPFVLRFEGRRPQARELVLLATMTALAVAGRAAFYWLPQCKPVCAIVILTAVAFTPEAGFVTGAAAGLISNFFFGQGPWTPWQMFCWGMIGFVAGLLENRGFFRRDRNRTYFTGSFWTRLCPSGTNRGDLLYFARGITNHASLRLCLYGMVTGFAYGWVMNLFFLTYVDPLTWKTALAAYVSSFFFDFCHGLCTFLVLWAVGEPWIAKLNRIKVKFGLIAEEKNYKMPPSQHTAPQAGG